MKVNYPISSHYFPQLIENNAIYIDKTRFIEPLLLEQNNATVFLSRPRRFGKSLFVSTLEQVFLGKKELFKGLYIYDKIEWEEFPVIRISMDKIGFSEAGLEKALLIAVQEIAKSYEVEIDQEYSSIYFQQLIQKLYKKYQKKVVVLIDEYDKPIINYLEKEQITQAEKNRDILKSFYGVLKDSVDILRFSFITGVSKFAKVSIFSDLNHFKDLTLDTRCAAICGFTEAEIRQYCEQGIEDLAAKNGMTVEETIAKIRFWYNGFSWNAKDFVYNPFSFMRLMESLEFDDYWFESGTPTFLIKLINEDMHYDFRGMQVESSIYSSHDLKNLDYVSVMLQTGYLTFKEHIAEKVYRIDYPNKEVENAFSKMLLDGYLHRQPGRMMNTIFDIEKAFKGNEVEKVITIVANMFKTLPSQFFQENTVKKDAYGNIMSVTKKGLNENFYHAVIYLIFNILGIRMQAEVTSQEGRIDAVVETESHVYIFEFKKNRNADTAIEQMESRNYAKTYALSKKQICLIGVSFNFQKKGISDYKIKILPK
jgi:Predicted AAA-ATPase/PD-(D/E)XK nuclease superfamily